MFERFTEKAIKIIMLAQEEARRLGHNFVGSEQIVLGILGEGTGIGAKTLKSMGVNLKDARVEIEKIIGRGSGFVAVEIPFTPRGKRILELAWDEARQLGHNYIGTEHLLLGLVQDAERYGGGGTGTRVLENMGVDLKRVRAHVIRLQGESGSYLAAGTPVELDKTLREREIKKIIPEIDDEDLEKLSAMITKWMDTRKEFAVKTTKTRIANKLTQMIMDFV